MNLSDWTSAHPAPPPQKRPRKAELNYSRLRAYIECPWLYKLRYVDFVPQPPSARASLGMTIHKALESYHREDAAELPRLLELYDRHFHHAGFTTPEAKAEWYKKGEAVLRRYFKDELGRRTEILALEREFLFELGPHVVRGTIDRVDRHPDGRVEIIDYKTGLDQETQADLAGNLQLAIYGLGAREGLGLEPSTLTLYYVAAGTRVSVPYDASREDELKAFLSRAGDLLAAADYRPDTSFCPACMFRDSCTFSVARD